MKNLKMRTIKYSHMRTRIIIPKDVEECHLGYKTVHKIKEIAVKDVKFTLEGFIKFIDEVVKIAKEHGFKYVYIPYYAPRAYTWYGSVAIAGNPRSIKLSKKFNQHPIYSEEVVIDVDNEKIYYRSTVRNELVEIGTINEIKKNIELITSKLRSLVSEDLLKKGKEVKKKVEEKKVKKEVKEAVKELAEKVEEFMYATSVSLSDVLSGKLPNVPCVYVIEFGRGKGRKRIKKTVYKCGEDLKNTIENLRNSVKNVFNISDVEALDLLTSIISSIDVYLIDVGKVFEKIVK